MNFDQTSIPGVILIRPNVMQDDRGFFMEIYNARVFAEAGIKFAFVQDNHSRSRQGTLRGLHYQVQHAQAKLVRSVRGEIFDVAVDLRRSSPTYGRWVGCVLSSENKQMMWIPEGFAHGFYALSEYVELAYKVTDYYAPESERTLVWNDPTVGIVWPLVGGRPPLLSPKDAAGQFLTEADTYA
jgi:dTDP-4-dehydrorhamnose 3,5-epimerase